ncbi:MAG: prephenate dehydrogenase [Bacteroidales bacterium]
MNVTIIGLGLIGGSLALALRQCGFAHRLVGIESNTYHTQQALSLGLVDEIVPLEHTALAQADLVIIAIPVDAIWSLLPNILDSIDANTVVVDMGSTKGRICKSVSNHPNRRQYVASHPMAGTEYSGPNAATRELFDKKKVIICEQDKCSDIALSRVQNMYYNLNMEILYYTDAQAHDEHIAYISHLSHVSSFMLGLTVLEVEKSERHILELAGTGFASTVRLAKSAPETWAPIFEQNTAHLSHTLDMYIANLQSFKSYLDKGDTTSLKKMMQKANQIKKIIK